MPNHPDTDSRKHLGKWHYTDGTTVFNFETGTTAIAGADPATFVVLKDRYARDASAAFFGCKRIEGADGASFAALGHGYARDAKRFYFDGVALDEAARGSKVRGWFLVGERAVFHAGVRLEADPATFELLVPPFARDRVSVFFHGAERKSYGACHALRSKLEGADAPSFTPLGTKWARFAKDRARVYAVNAEGATVLASADADSFRLLEEHKEFAADRERVWFGNQVVVGADARSFVVDVPLHFARDAAHVYYGAERLDGADPASFEFFPESAWGRDHQSVFFMAERCEGVDASTFAVIDCYEARDRTNLYYRGTLMGPARATDKLRKAHAERLAKAKLR